jgi:hypothetical protein
MDRPEGLVVPRAEQRDQLVVAAQAQQWAGDRQAAEPDGLG